VPCSAAETERMEDNGRGRSRWPLWAFTGVMTAGAAALCAVVAARAPTSSRAPTMPWFVLIAAFALVELYPLYFQLRGETHSFGLNEIALVFGLFMVPPFGLLAAAMLARRGGEQRHRPLS